jgi:GntR family transcriptional regulator of arabinose operon
VINRNDPLPLYYQLAEQIKAQIESGQIKIGDKLPSESEMVEAYGIGRLTVRGALSQLVNAGYLKKVHGKGTYCIASQLNAKRLNIDVILDMEDAYFISYHVKSTSAVLAAHNCNFIISDSHDDSETIADILEKIPLRSSSGVIVQPCHRCGEVSERIKAAFRNLRIAGIPYVMIDNVYEGIETSYTILDEYKGGCIAARYLQKLGHRFLAATSIDQVKDSFLRCQGFSETIAKLGLPPPLLFPYGPNPEKTLVKELKTNNITALFCYNDEVAVRCLRILKDSGIAVPSDISVLSFDDTILASTVEPALSCIAHPKQKMGNLAAQTLLDLINKKTAWPVGHIFEPRLIKRDSCTNPAYIKASAPKLQEN